ncbi:FAD-dependent oxidoreductase [Rhabdobacter roseus]|uniref:Glycerol-3-phosphate dehydrogenase n=1 Tax=Rhabdobacter roseus TaxID=1655419 RepID=A0A840TW51_9BACT|nr:FAD-dependent oxidoreductase [Rhabdobacter roseus]MBB5283869.1 glycerol-3-phosphate dehydrogenase [Rhabdobacter roseus]
MNRSPNLRRLQEETFDICIIGAGASGAGCALDAALRGYRVALIDKKDFASETSSRSTKLIHGGVRYLDQAFKNLDFAQLTQVRHGLQERHIVLKNAPHLARPLALLTPVGSWLEGLYFSIGLRLYDWFAQQDSLPVSRWLNKKEVLRRMPTLNPSTLHSAVLYHDGQLDDARYCLALVQSAAEAGVAVANYLSVCAFEKDSSGKLQAALVEDQLGAGTFPLRARLFINCTGPYSDFIRLQANPQLPPRIRPSKGVHVVLPREVLGSQDAMLIPKTSDGRVVFAIPFEGELLLGTTDTEYTQLEKEPVLEKKEVDFLLSTLQPFLAQKLDPRQVKAGFGGLRPLLAADPRKATKRLTRDHEVEHDEVSGLLSLLGGKWTTYRLMAKDTLDAADQLLGHPHPCRTADHTLAGGEGYSYDHWQTLQSTYQLPPDVCQHLVLKYGSRAERVAGLTVANPVLAERLVPRYPYLKAEVLYATQHEMAVVPRDVLARRLRLEITDWQATLHCLPTVVALMAQVLGWEESTQQQHIEAYQKELNFFRTEAEG